MVLEEAAYCDTQVVNEVVLPLLSMRDSVLLCISTLLESSNHYSRMFTLKTPNGQPLFETSTFLTGPSLVPTTTLTFLPCAVQISLVCDACLQTDHPEKCTHKAAEMPRWLSSSKLETIKTLLADDPALLMRESMGISAETTTRAFPEPHVVAYLERPKLMPSRCKFVYTSVDPAGGGSSNFAIASVCLMDDGRVMVRPLSFHPRLYSHAYAHTHAHVHKPRLHAPRSINGSIKGPIKARRSRVR